MWVKFVVGSSPCPECFSPGPLVFLSPQTPTLQIQILPGNSGQEEPHHEMFTAKFLIPFLLICFEIKVTI